MRTIFSILCITLIAFSGLARAEDKAPKALKALLITGGCCHDYSKQKDLLKAGLEARAHIVTGAVSAAQNIVKCVQRCELEVDDIILQQLASSRAVPLLRLYWRLGASNKNKSSA